METGTSVAYALWKLEDRGKFFIGAQEQVYQGMILGEHSRENDLEINPLKGKEADQCTRLGHRRSRAPDHAGQDVSGAGHRLYRR